MSMTVLVGAMVDFVSPLRYCPTNSRPFASDSFNPSTSSGLEHERLAAENFRIRIEFLQEVKSQCDRLKHIKVRKIDQSASNISSHRACYFGLVDVALHACWYSMCKRSEERCKYNIPQHPELQSYPFETYCPLKIDVREREGVIEYEETPQIAERWSSGLVFLNNVMFPSLSMCSDPSSKAIRVCVVSSVCNFLRICASLDPLLFKFLFIRDVVPDHRLRHASKVSSCHLLLEAAAACIDLEPEVSLCVHNKAVRIVEEDEELDDEENRWFPFGLLYLNFKAHLEPDSDLFCMARLSSTFRLMKSLCSLSLLSAGTPMLCPMNPDVPHPPSMYDIYHLEVWLSWLHNFPSDNCPIKSYLEDDDAEDNQYFTDPFFLICYMMICQEGSDIKALPGFQNDRQAAEDYFSNHFIKVCPHSHELNNKKNHLLAQYFKGQLENPVNGARDFSAQLLKETIFDRESEDFKLEFENRELNHERMVTNWIDFLSAYVELNSKRLSCPYYDISEVDDRDELERLVNTLKDVLSVKRSGSDNEHSVPDNVRIFNQMQKYFNRKESRCTRWNQMIDGNRPPSSPSELSRLSSQHLQHPLEDENPSHKGAVFFLGICVSVWMFPYTTTPVKASLVRYLRCHLDSVHRFHRHLSDQHLPLENELKDIKEQATKKCRWLFCIEGQQEPRAGVSPVILAINRDFLEKEWSHTIELLKLLRVMLMFEVQHFAYIHDIIECLCSKLKCFSLSDDEVHYVMFQRFEVITCFANILADLCESFDPADYFMSHQAPCKISDYCNFRYAILRRVCNFQSNREPLCLLFLRVLSLISRHSYYAQLMPSALAACRLLLTAHEKQKELGNLRAGNRFICRPFEDDSLDSFEAIMISNMAVPYLLCAAGHMEIRTLPALSLFMSCLHPNNFNTFDDKSEPASSDSERMNQCSHRIFLTFPKQLCSWASSSTLFSLSDSVLLLSSSLLLLSRILEDAAQSIPNSSHGILSQVLSTAAVHSSHRCGPALNRVDQTLAFVVQTLLDPDGHGFFIFHSHLMVRHDDANEIEDDFYDVHQCPLIYTWILDHSGSALSTSSGRLSKFLSCQSIVHRNILIGDYFCKFSFGSANAFGTFHPFNLQVFDRQEAHDDIFQKLMDVGTERSYENVKGNFSSSANVFVDFIALVRALACVSVNSICDILSTCPAKADSTEHAPSLAHILLNQHAMYSHSIVDDSSFVNSQKNYRASLLLRSLLGVVKCFWTSPSEFRRFENLNKRMVWLLPIISRSWEIIALLLDDPFSRLLCAHVIQISRDSGEAWLWGTGGELNIEASPRNTGLSALIDCASFLDYFLKMNSSLDPSVDLESGVDLDYVYLNQLHDIHAHSVHAIAWSVKALTSMVWIVTTLCPERFSYDFRGLIQIWNWAEAKQVWNRSFVDNFPSDDVLGPDYDEDDMSVDHSDNEPAGPTLESSILHVIKSRSNFFVEQQLFELLLRCQNNEFDNVVVEMGLRVPSWFISRLQDWYFFEDRMMLGEVLASGVRVPQSSSHLELPKDWENMQSKASRFNVSLLSRPSSNFRWIKSSHDPFRIVDRSKLELVFNAPDPGSMPNQEAFKGISLHALHFNHALLLKSSKCHLAQSLGSFFPVIFRTPPSSHFNMEVIYAREEVSTCVIFIDFALRMCLFLRDWLVTHHQADFTLRFFKAARTAIFRLKGLPDVDKESFLEQNRPLFLKISENISQIIISKSSTVNQAAVLERQELYKLLLEYLSAFQGNDSAFQGGDFVLQHVLCSDEQRYLPLAFYTILRDVADANSFHSIEAMLLLALLLRLVPSTLAIVNVVASRASFGSPLIDFVDGPLSQSQLFSSVFHARCSLLSRIVQRNPSLIAPVIVAMRDSPFFVKKGAFFSVVSSQQHAQQTMATFADQVIAFHLVANSFMCTIFRCASVLDTLFSYSASEGLLELLHFLHAGFYSSRSEDSVQGENWLLRLLRHFAGSRDPYLDYLVRRRACLPTPFMRPFSSLATALYEQVNAAVLSLAVLQRHRVRSWAGAAPWLRVFNVADKEIPQLLVNTALFDTSVANLECFDILELPRDRFAQGDVEYDGLMAIYQSPPPPPPSPHFLCAKLCKSFRQYQHCVLQDAARCSIACLYLLPSSSRGMPHSQRSLLVSIPL